MKLLASAASPHGIITGVTTALINTVQRQIKTHNALLCPHGDSNQLMTVEMLTKLFMNKMIQAVRD